MAAGIDVRDVLVFLRKAADRSLALVLPHPADGWDAAIQLADSATAVRVALAETWLNMFRTGIIAIGAGELWLDPHHIMHGRMALAAACEAALVTSNYQGSEFVAIVADAMMLLLHNLSSSGLQTDFLVRPTAGPANFAAAILSHPRIVAAFGAGARRGAGLRSRLRSMLDYGSPDALSLFMRLPGPHALYQTIMIGGSVVALGNAFTLLAEPRVAPSALVAGHMKDLWGLQTLRPFTLALFLPQDYLSRWSGRALGGENRASNAAETMHAARAPAALWQSRFWRTMGVLLPCRGPLSPPAGSGARCWEPNDTLARTLRSADGSYGVAVLAANAELEAAATVTRLHGAGTGATLAIELPRPSPAPIPTIRIEPPVPIPIEPPRPSIPIEEPRPPGPLYPVLGGSGGPTVPGQVPAPFPISELPGPGEQSAPRILPTQPPAAPIPVIPAPGIPTAIIPAPSIPTATTAPIQPAPITTVQPVNPIPILGTAVQPVPSILQPPPAPAIPVPPSILAPPAAVLPTPAPSAPPAHISGSNRPGGTGPSGGPALDEIAALEERVRRIESVAIPAPATGTGGAFYPGGGGGQHYAPVNNNTIYLCAPGWEAMGGTPGNPVRLARRSPGRPPFRPPSSPFPSAPSSPTFPSAPSSPSPSPPASPVRIVASPGGGWSAPPASSPVRAAPFRPAGRAIPLGGLPVPAGPGIPPAYADSDPRGGRPWCGKGLLTALPNARPGEPPYGHFGSRSECFAVGQVVGNALGPRRTA